MGAYKESVENINIVATGTVAKKRFATRLGAQAGAASTVIGVNDFAVVAGQTMLIDYGGTTTVEAGAAIAANVTERRLQTDSDGRAVTFTTGPAVAILRPGSFSTAAGQEISVHLIQGEQVVAS